MAVTNSLLNIDSEGFPLAKEGGINVLCFGGSQWQVSKREHGCFSLFADLQSFVKCCSFPLNVPDFGTADPQFLVELGVIEVDCCLC